MAPPQLCGCTCLHLECAQPWCAEPRPCVDLRSGPGLGERFWGPLPEKGWLLNPPQPHLFSLVDQAAAGLSLDIKPRTQDTLCLGPILQSQTTSMLHSWLSPAPLLWLFEVISSRFRTLSKRQIWPPPEDEGKEAPLCLSFLFTGETLLSSDLRLRHFQNCIFRPKLNFSLFYRSRNFTN